MKLEYQNDNLILRILDRQNAIPVLDFYQQNRRVFDPYETAKPDHFYTENFIANLLSAEYNAFVHGRHVRFFLFDTAHPNEIIGTVSFSNITNGSVNSCTIGYKIDQKYQRQGYGRRMLTMALKIMVTSCSLHRIEAYISPDNTASIALAKTLGFISEGTAYAYVRLNGRWQDHLRYVYIS